MVMVVKNNYHWVKGEAGTPAIAGGQDETGDTDRTAEPSMDFIANGDVAQVRKVRREREMHGFRFADVIMTFPDYEDQEVEATVLLDTLHSEAPALTHAQQEQLFQHVWDDYPELRIKRDRMKAVKEDMYFNALQIKYAYAVTCHKAQGGQWERVFLDQGYITEEMLSPDYFRWLYTAMTRATERLYLLNWPKTELDEEPT
jgi:exodeoxyribonuclease-5